MLKIDNEELEAKTESKNAKQGDMIELCGEISDLKQKGVSVLILDRENKTLKDKLNNFEADFENLTIKYVKG